MNSPVVEAQDFRFAENGVEEVVKKVILPLWNTYYFFVTYANIDGFDTEKIPLESKNPPNPLYQGGKAQNTPFDKVVQHQNTSLDKEGQYQNTSLDKEEQHQNTSLDEEVQHQNTSLDKEGQHQNTPLDKGGQGGILENNLDKWLISELNKLIKDVSA
jgi:hypothetical protein